MRLSVVLAVAAILAVSPASAQKRATFVTGTFTENAEGCQRLKDIRSGRITAPLLSTPVFLTAKGIGDNGGSFCRFKSISVLRSGVRWRAILACVDDGIPLESTADFTKRSKDQIVIFVREFAVYYPANLGVGDPVPGKPDLRVVRNRVAETQRLERCNL
jgi:hypothetical protein